MGMGFYVAVKPFLAVDHPKGNHEAFLLKKVDIPVHRTQGKVGDHWFKLLIHPLGPGMGYSGTDSL
jgi:hypothetical protein